MATTRAPLTRQTIVDEAIALAREQGVDALAMRQLAIRLGVTAPALYAYFAGRAELLAACAQVGYDELENRFHEEQSESAMDMIWVSSRSYVRFAMDEPELFALMFMFRPEAIEIATEHDIEHGGATNVFDAMIANLGQAIAEGELRPAEPLDYGLALWAAVHGVATVAGLATGLDIDRLLDQVVGGLLEGWKA